jgi:thioredoxin reductase
LGVPGEELGKVVYRLIDPEQYAGRRVLVVGGGDSALEAAVSLAEQPGTTVTLSYRGSAFTRARAKNRDRMSMMKGSGKVTELLGSEVIEVRASDVVVAHNGNHLKIANDDVIVCAGGILPTQFLHDIGIEVETKFGTV